MPKLFFFFILSLTSIILPAQFDFQLTFSSRFLDRGFDVFAENHPAVQPELSFYFGQSGLSLNLFASFPLKNYSQLSTLNEIDLTLNYSFQIKNLNLFCGFTNYGWYFSKPFTFKNSTSQEIYLGAELEEIPLSPRLYFYYDFGNGDGLYIEAYIAHTFKITKNIEVNLDLWQGYNNGQWGVKKGLSDLNLKIASEIPLGKFAIIPFFWYCRIFNQEINPQRSEIVFGLSLKNRR